MTSDLANRARDLFGLALEQDPASRKAFLDEHCAGDELLRKEVDSLLIAHQQSESFLEPPARQHPPEESQSAPLTETSASSTQTATPDRALPENLSTTKTIGRFRILGVLGEGGMGVVYDAQQQHPRRRVALPLSRSRRWSSPALRTCLSADPNWPARCWNGSSGSTPQTRSAGRRYRAGRAVRTAGLYFRRSSSVQRSVHKGKRMRKSLQVHSFDQLVSLS